MKVFIGLLLSTLSLVAQTSPWVGEISGLITTTPGYRRLPNVEVEIAGIDSDYSKSRVSSASGTFKMEQVPAGKYKVTVRKRGFTSVAMIVEVENHKNTGIVIRMKPDTQEAPQPKG